MNYRHSLNSEQLLATESINGPLLVLAGAGSGKTRVVTYRIAYLLENGIDASRILGLTFTNKAAGEMKDRVHKLTNSSVLICTFHSLGARILRESIAHLGYQRNFIIYDEDDIEKLLKTCRSETVTTKQDIKRLRHQISSVKNGQLPLTALDPFSESIYLNYQKKLKEYNAVDYDDLLYLPVQLFQEHPQTLAYYQNRWSYLLIDEYQDTNNVQYSFVQLLVQQHQNLCVVGDPDQSIYSWRGANIKNIMAFEKDFPGAIVVRLEQNYRSRSNILDAANAVIANNRGRYEKNLITTRGPGEKVKVCRTDDDRAEAAFIANRIAFHQHEHDIPLNQMVVFYRTNAQSRSFEDCFLQNKIPYTIVGGISFYQRREIKDILAWLRMIQSSNDWISFTRTINMPKRGLGDATIEKIRIQASLAGRSILNFCEDLISEQAESPIKLTSRQKTGLREYITIIQALKKACGQLQLSELVKHAIQLTNYEEYLKEEPETVQDRLENLDALMAKAFEWNQTTAEVSLSSFLEELSLRSSLDEADEQQEKVSLMTIHHGKGLEFDVTFIAGMEEQLFPHVNSLEKPESLEEERRLFYVGMTRAKEFLYLTYASVRLLWGALRTQRGSRFMGEIPLKYYEKVAPSYQRQSTRYQPTPSLKHSLKKSEGTDERFDCGDLIFHKEFGVGRIDQVYDGQAGLTYKILFSNNTIEKTLAAQDANLSKL